MPAYVAWKDPNAVIVHNPNELETKRGYFGTSAITATDHLYVRNNVTPPDSSILADRGAWQVAFDGVRNPRTLSVAELKTVGVETVASVLQCSGNGRAFFPHKPSGAKWTVGASGCVLWSGVPVRYIAEALGGVAPGMQYLTGTGGETFPTGIDPLTVMVERSLPIEAMNDALLAWEMNGEPLPLAHGGPLRLVVPGYQGVNNVKYIKRVAFTPVESSASIQKLRYRLNAIGTTATTADPSVLGMTVKSFVTSPSGGEPIRAGVVYVTGVAFGGGSPIKRVEVSSDGGKSWVDAPFIGPDLGRFAWRQFAMPLRMAPGTTPSPAARPMPRVGCSPSSAAKTQPAMPTRAGPTTRSRSPLPEQRRPAAACALGAAAVVLVFAAPLCAAADGEPQLAEGRALFTSGATPPCAICHTLKEAGAAGAVGPSLDELKPDETRVATAVRGGIGAMPSFATTLSDAQIRALARYVAKASGGAPR